MSQPTDNSTDNTNKRKIVNVIADTAPKSANQTNPTDQNNQTESTAPRAKLNRRRFLQGMGGTAIGATSLGMVGCGDDDDGSLFGNFNDTAGDGVTSPVAVAYNHGVASGDPLSDKVILWTRVTPEKAGSYTIPVKWQIGTDEQMQIVVASGDTETQPKNDYTIKVDATGLAPDTVYYYRFMVQSTNGEHVSPIGKTKTLPTGDVSQVKMAVFSCSNYPAGYFHAYKDASQQTDLDVVVHLGDYIYEYGRDVETNEGELLPAYASANAKELGREVEPAEEIISIDDYRKRYAQYRTDPDLQALHANLPMIAVWDDHELTNDAWQDGAENHQPTTEGKWDDRKLSAVTAYHEWMPTRNAVPSEIYRTFDFGDLVSLHMLDTRVIGREEQLNYLDFIKQDAEGKPYIDADAFEQASYDADRQLLGLKQNNWLVSNMSTSNATWQILGQQVLMGRMLMPAPVILNFFKSDLGFGEDDDVGVSIATYLGILNTAQNSPETLTDEQKTILAQPNVPYNLDAWDGYGSAREAILTASKQQGKNLVVLAGDTHNAWANDLETLDGDAVGVEFATSSVSSPGLEEYVPFPPTLVESVFTSLIEKLQYLNASQRGYMLITATPEKCQSEWVYVSDILEQTYTAEVGKTMSVNVGENKLSEI